jgi:hypothetical protein
MQRIVHKENKCIVGYHTQEYRVDSQPLNEPIICRRKNAWLGEGYYFWTDLDIAHYWGKDSKMNTGSYDIYRGYIESDKLINTVFDEKGYNFFVDKVKKTVVHLQGLSRVKVDIQMVNRYLTDNIWNKLGINGIIFEDIPQNNEQKGRIYSEIPPLHYFKRIQINVLDKKIIHNFGVLLEDQY